MDDLVERADYCHEHGLFDAVEAGKYVTYADLAAEIRSLRKQVAKERAGIVRWLRRGHDTYQSGTYARCREMQQYWDHAADAIERQQDKEPT